MAYPILYQINTRCWLRELSELTGRRVTLANIPEELPARWEQLGFTHIWLMGVWTTGPGARNVALWSEDLRLTYSQALPGWTDKDVTGSPYAIAAYSVPRELGGNVALKKFRRLLRERGLKLILDFVPNHLGIDHPWVRSQPELFVQSDAADDASFIGGSADSPLRLCHGRDPFFTPWKDTVQLDYRRADTRSVMTLELLQLADLCDGVRCDMAMLLINEVFHETWKSNPCRVAVESNEFWVDAIAVVKERQPAFQLIAEAYWNREPELLRQGFDFAYQKAITDAMYDHPQAVQKVVHDGLDWLPQGIHFLENHDERRAAARLGLDAHRADLWTLLTLPGMRFLQEGQLEGWRIQTPVQLGRRRFEEVDARVLEMYQQLLGVLPETPVGRSEFQVLPPRSAWEGNSTNQCLLVTQWGSLPDEFFLAVVNLAPHRSQGYVSPTLAQLGAHDWQMIDLLGEEHYQRSGTELQNRGLYLDVSPYATQLFRFRHGESS